MKPSANVCRAQRIKTFLICAIRDSLLVRVLVDHIFSLWNIFKNWNGIRELRLQKKLCRIV